VANEKTAVAVTYLKDLPAPFIVAKGRRELAERLLEIAENCGVEIVTEPELSETLYQLDVGSFIPEQLYEIIARILAQVLKIRKSI